MKSILVALMVFANSANALEGKYIYADHNGVYTNQRAWVEIRKTEPSGFKLVFNVPCGTKLIPRVFKINESSSIGGELELLDPGANQCDTGSSPSLFLVGNNLTIYTHPRVLTPGFNGTYKFTRQE